MSDDNKRTSNGAAIVVQILQREKVRFVFGIPGTHNIELYDSFYEAEGITPVLITDEQSAAFMADGVTRASGELSAVNLVPGAGLTHALSGIAECYFDQIPLLVLMCGVRTDTGNAFQLHDIDQVAIAKPVCKKVFQPRTHHELYLALSEACREARAAPCGPVAVEVSANLYLSPGDWKEVEAETASSVPNAGSLAKAAEILNQSEKVGMYAGKSLENCSAELLALAEKLDAIVFTTVSGKGVFPESHARFAWNALGRAAPSAIQASEKALDCVLAMGCRFAEVATGSYGVAQPKTLIHVDIDSLVFDQNLRADLKIQMDSAEFVRALLAPGLLKQRTSRAKAPAPKAINTASSNDSVSPARLRGRLQDLCGEKSVFVADSGNGAFMMTGFEMATAATYGAGVIFLLLRDRELSQISQFQKMVLGRQIGTRTPDYDSEALAKGLGVAFLRMDKDDEIDSIMRHALEISESKTPVLVEVKIDYSVPTHFFKGVVKTNFLRLPWKDRLRMVSRVVQRKFF
ncbi:thiamine pyrophosphate-binding protein [Bdellovibrionota bacterium FG-2]